MAESAECSRIDTPVDVVSGSKASFFACCRESNRANTGLAHRTVTISSFGVTMLQLAGGTNFTTTSS